MVKLGQSGTNFDKTNGKQYSRVVMSSNIPLDPKVEKKVLTHLVEGLEIR